MSTGFCYSRWSHMYIQFHFISDISLIPHLCLVVLRSEGSPLEEGRTVCGVRSSSLHSTFELELNKGMSAEIFDALVSPY